MIYITTILYHGENMEKINFKHDMMKFIKFEYRILGFKLLPSYKYLTLNKKLLQSPSYAAYVTNISNVYLSYNNNILINNIKESDFINQHTSGVFSLLGNI